MPPPPGLAPHRRTETQELLFGNQPSAADDSPPTESRAFFIARLLLVIALFGAPWAFGAVMTWGWVALGLAACLILLLWAVGSVQRRVVDFAWSPVYLPVGLFFLLGIVQYTYGLALDRSETRQALVLLAVDVALFFVTMQLFSTASGAAWHAFGLVVLVLAGSLGLFAILQFASGEPRIYGQVDTPGNLFFGPYVNPNHFAGLMEMLVPVAAFCIAERRGRPSLAVLAWLAAGAAVAVASLLLSGSRGGLLALAAEAVIAITVVHGFRARHLGKRSLAAVVAATILAAVLLFTWVDPGIATQKLGLLVKVGGPAWKEWAQFRKVVASDSLRMLQDHPVTGVGLGNFAVAYPRYQSFPSDMWIDYAHNDYVQAAAETGLLGASLMTATVLIFLRLAFAGAQGVGPIIQVRNRGFAISKFKPGSGAGIRNPAIRARYPSPGTDLAQGTEDAEHNPDESLGPELPPGHWIRLGAALGCCGMLVHSFFDFNLHIPANAAWFAVLAGIACCVR